MLQPEYCGKWLVSIAVHYCWQNVLISLMQVLQTLLKEWRKDPTNKVLIFTKSVKLLEMLDFHLEQEGSVIRCLSNGVYSILTFARLEACQIRWLCETV